MRPPAVSSDAEDLLSSAFAYHQRTKHHLSRYARGPGHLDWSSQPAPFRTFAEAPVVQLPLLADSLRASFRDLYVPGAVRTQRLDLATLGILFELSLGLSAWKEFRGSRWALRCNPSSGNLHPTEGYTIVPSLPELVAGVYHYDSEHHCLERRCSFGSIIAQRLAAALPPSCFLVGLSSIHWREAWKYGERAFRYCQHDLGHAFAALRYAAAALGWSALLLDHLGDQVVSTWLGLDNAEGFAGAHPLDREHPGSMILIGPAPLSFLSLPTLGGADVVWSGRARSLGQQHRHWEVIDTVARATHRPFSPPMLVPETAHFHALPPDATTAEPLLAATLIRQRRSCLGLDGRTVMDATDFFNILERVLPGAGTPPWDLLCWRAQVHLALFVHRVRGLKSGLYLLERDPSVHDTLCAALSPRFLWQRTGGIPESLPLFLLAEGDFQDVARTVSCHQDIAADGAFSLGMIAHFGPGIRQQGAWWYRRLFWEAGVVGQVLYLEAEAAGARGTGIGCYFDDAMHQVLGIAGDELQDLYHFTIGTPVEDARLRTIHPYAHLSR